MYFDLRFRRIPNWLTFPVMVAGIAYHTCVGGIPGLALSIGGLLFGFCLFFVFYTLGGMGAGDVKLMAAIGSLLGPKDVLFAALYTAIAGGVYAILLLLPKNSNREALARYSYGEKPCIDWTFYNYIPKGEREKTTPLCYGIAIAIGTLIVLAQRMP